MRFLLSILVYEKNVMLYFMTIRNVIRQISLDQNMIRRTKLFIN